MIVGKFINRVVGQLKSRVNPQTEWSKAHLEDCPSSITWIDVDFDCLFFFFRYRIRGIKNIVFYELPHYAHFYPEIVNYMDTSLESGKISASNCAVLYSKFDIHRLSAVVGTTRCQQMTASEQIVHMFVTGE